MNKLAISSLMLAATLMLSACDAYTWTKPGTSPIEKEHAETACQAQALRELPPDNVRASRSTYNDRHKDENSRAYDTTVDANIDQRKVLVNDCMYKKGWSRVKQNAHGL